MTPPSPNLPPAVQTPENHFAHVSPAVGAIISACGVFVSAARRRLQWDCDLDTELSWVKVNTETCMDLHQRVRSAHGLAANERQTLDDAVWRTEFEVLFLLATTCVMQRQHDRTVFVLTVVLRAAVDCAARQRPRLDGVPVAILPAAALEVALERAVEHTGQAVRDTALPTAGSGGGQSLAVLDDQQNLSAWLSTLSYLRLGGQPVLYPRTTKDG